MESYYECGGVTRRGRLCTRRARYLYLRGEGTSAAPARVVQAYCGTHYRSHEPMALLRPLPWEYDEIVDIQQHAVVVGAIGVTVGRSTRKGQ